MISRAVGTVNVNAALASGGQRRTIGLMCQLAQDGSGMNAEGKEGRFPLPDGRILGYAEYGLPDGAPVLFFQGTPSTRLMHPPTTITRELRARLITVDRPGFGQSTPAPGRTLLDWPGDVARLLDSLGVGEFVTAGLSGGGPYVLATAWRLRDRVRAAAVCGGSGPVEMAGALRGITLERRLGYLLARHFPGVLRQVVRRYPDPRRDPARFIRRYTRHNPPADQRIIAEPEFHRMYLANFAEAQRQGPAAFAEEVILGARPWGFALEEINVPVHFWQGELDNSTPRGMAEGMAARIPGAKLTVLPGEGHLFAVGPRWREVLQALLAEGAGA